MKSYRTEYLGLVSAIGLLSMLAFASSAHAHGGPKFGFGGPGLPGAELMKERIAERLDLDETQRQEVANIIEAARPEFQALRESARANRETLASLDPAAANYAVDLENAAAENGRLATDATLLAARVRNEISAVLSEEQLAELEQIKASGRDRGNRERGDRRRGNRR